MMLDPNPNFEVKKAGFLKWEWRSAIPRLHLDYSVYSSGCLVISKDEFGMEKVEELSAESLPVRALVITLSVW